MKTMKSKRVVAQRKFAQGATLPIPTISSPLPVLDRRKEGKINLIQNNLCAKILLDVVSFKNNHSHKIAVVAIQRLGNEKIKTDCTPAENSRASATAAPTSATTLAAPCKTSTPAIKNNTVAKPACTSTPAASSRNLKSASPKVASGVAQQRSVPGWARNENRPLMIAPKRHSMRLRNNPPLTPKVLEKLKMDLRSSSPAKNRRGRPPKMTLPKMQADSDIEDERPLKYFVTRKGSVGKSFSRRESVLSYPGSKTNTPPQPRTTIPRSVNNTPQPDSSALESSTSTPLPKAGRLRHKASTPLHGSKTKRSSTSTPLPGTGTPLPGTSSPLPGTSTPLRRTSTSRPGCSTLSPGSNTPCPGSSTPHPESSTPHPESSTPHPGSSTPRPWSSTPRPGWSTPRPGSCTPQPRSSTPRSRTSTPRPGSTISRSMSSTPRPGSCTPQPRSSTPRSRTSTPRPASTISRSMSSTPRPGSCTPQPRSSTPRSRTSTPRPGPSNQSVRSTTPLLRSNTPLKPPKKRDYMILRSTGSTQSIERKLPVKKYYTQKLAQNLAQSDFNVPEAPETPEALVQESVLKRLRVSIAKLPESNILYAVSTTEDHEEPSSLQSELIVEQVDKDTTNRGEAASNTLEGGAFAVGGYINQTSENQEVHHIQGPVCGQVTSKMPQFTFITNSNSYFTTTSGIGDEHADIYTHFETQTDFTEQGLPSAENSVDQVEAFERPCFMSRFTTFKEAVDAVEAELNWCYSNCKSCNRVKKAREVQKLIDVYDFKIELENPAQSVGQYRSGQTRRSCGTTIDSEMKETATSISKNNLEVVTAISTETKSQRDTTNELSLIEHENVLDKMLQNYSGLMTRKTPSKKKKYTILINDTSDEDSEEEPPNVRQNRRRTSTRTPASAAPATVTASAHETSHVSESVITRLVTSTSAAGVSAINTAPTLPTVPAATSRDPLVTAAAPDIASTSSAPAAALPSSGYNTRARPARKTARMTSDNTDVLEDGLLSVRTACHLQEAPVFHPTPEEFEDPIAYFDIISPKFAKFGLCKIVPPKGFTPPCYVPEDIRFTVHNQYISRMYTRWGPASREMCAIKAHASSQSIVFIRSPLFEGLELNLPRLYHLVQKNGGLKRVMEAGRWNRVADEMQFNRVANAAKRVDQLYVKYVVPYDLLSTSERNEIMATVECRWAQKNQRMLERALKPFHHMRQLMCETDSSAEESDEPNDFYAMAIKETEDCVTNGRLLTLVNFKKIAANAMSTYFPKRSDVNPAGSVATNNDNDKPSYEPFAIMDDATENFTTTTNTNTEPIASTSTATDLPSTSAASNNTPSTSTGANNNTPNRTTRRRTRKYIPKWRRKDYPSTGDIEREYWRLMWMAVDHVCVNVAAIDTGKDGYGFPTNPNEPFVEHPWNLKMLRKNPRNVLGSLGNVLGVTVPTLHLGMVFGTSCWHRDPHGLPWMEYMHSGPNKIWYGVPHSQSDAFRAAAETLCPISCQRKTVWLPSDVMMIPPHLLCEHNVRLTRVVQKPGEFVVIHPKAYSSSICTGFTVSENVYFASASWLDDVARVFQEVRDSCEPTMFSLDQLLIALLEDPGCPLHVLKKALPLLKELISEELALRWKMSSQLAIISEDELPTTSPRSRPHRASRVYDAWNVRDQAECEACRTTLYMTKVVDLNRRNSNLCLLHADRLLPKLKRPLPPTAAMVTMYANVELREILINAEARLADAQ